MSFFWSSSFCSSAALHKCTACISRAVLRCCSMLCVREYTERLCLLFYLLLSVFSLCIFSSLIQWMIIFGVYFSRVFLSLLCVTVQIHNEVGTNERHHAHTLMFVASNVLLLLFYFFLSISLFHSQFFFLESIEYEICFYSFGGYER